jgi:thioredoxin reductase (NADPH)
VDPRAAHQDNGGSETRRDDTREVECIVVGGGAAGLSAAVNLARMRRSILLVDERDRFLWRHVIHNYLGFPNGIPAVEIRRLGWRQAANYGAELLIGHVATAVRVDGGFRFGIEPPPWPKAGRDAEMARLFGEVPEGGHLDVWARTIVLATGVMGHFPEFPGRDECVGVSLFWCLHCDGYESTDRAVGVVGHDEEAIETALCLLDFTDRVTLVAGRPEGFDVPASRLSDLEDNGIAAHPCAVAQYRCESGHMRALVLDDATRTMVPVEHVYAVRRSTPTIDLARQLGLALDANGQIQVDTTQHTSVSGVYAAGDITSPHNHQLSAAVHEGNEAAASANYYLYRPVQRDPSDTDVR